MVVELGCPWGVKTLGEQGCKEIEGVPSQASIVARLKLVDVLGNSRSELSYLTLDHTEVLSLSAVQEQIACKVI